MRSIQKGKGIFSFSKKKSKENNAKQNSTTVNNSSTTRTNTGDFREKIAKNEELLNNLKENLKKLVEEIDEHKKKALELSREGKKSEALDEIKKYKPKKELETKKLNGMIENLSEIISQLKIFEVYKFSQEKGLMKGGDNNDFVFNNPMHKKRKTLKRSKSSKNLYSNVDSLYGKLKRNLELPVNATPKDVSNALDKLISEFDYELPNSSVIEMNELDPAQEEELLKELAKLER